MKDVKLIRMISGEEIVAEVLDFSNGILTMFKMLLVSYSSTRTGRILLHGQQLLILIDQRFLLI